MAREEPIAPSAAMAAATKNNEQNIRRHRANPRERTSAKKGPVRTGRLITTRRLKKAEREVDFVFMAGMGILRERRGPDAMTRARYRLC